MGIQISETLLSVERMLNLLLMPAGPPMSSPQEFRREELRSSNSENSPVLLLPEMPLSITCVTGSSEAMNGNPSALRPMVSSMMFQRVSCSLSHAQPLQASTLQWLDSTLMMRFLWLLSRRLPMSSLASVLLSSTCSELSDSAPFYRVELYL